MIINLLRIAAAPHNMTNLQAMVAEADREYLGQVQADINSGVKYQLEISRVKKARSLTANAYYQVLLDKLTTALGSSRDEVHESLLQQYGVTQSDRGEPCTFLLLSHQDPHKVAKYCDAIKWMERNGRTWTLYRVLKPSHEMSANEFCNLLEGIIYECKELNIEVLPPSRVEQLEADLKKLEEERMNKQ